MRLSQEYKLQFWKDTMHKVLNNIPYVIAGGYPRDLHFGVPPKDIDFFIKYSKSVEKSLIKLLEELGLDHTVYKQGMSLDDFGDSSQDACEDGYGSALTEGVKTVIKVGDYVDLILVSDRIDRVTTKFDFNINQFELKWTGEVVFKGNTEYTVLEQLRDVPEKRLIKMHGKAEKLGLAILPFEDNGD